jgi:hypothetical protein
MNDFVVVLDACVLVQACLRDTLLRLAEEPALYRPAWSSHIIDETARALERKLGLSQEQIARLIGQLESHFREAWVEGYEGLIEAMRVHEGDRHVAAAAVRAGAQAIVTFNVRHFAAEPLKAFGLEVQTPDIFLVHQFHLNPQIVCRKIVEQAAAIGRSPEQILATLSKSAPKFAEFVDFGLSANEF